MRKLSPLEAWHAHSAASFSFACRAARRMHIGLAEVAALEHLQVEGPLTPGQIGARLSMPSGSVTNLIDRLEGKKFIIRKANPSDRRGCLVHLSEQAWEKASLDLLPMAKRIDEIASQLSKADQDVVAAFLTDVADALNLDN